MLKLAVKDRKNSFTRGRCFFYFRFPHCDCFLIDFYTVAEIFSHFAEFLTKAVIKKLFAVPAMHYSLPLAMLLSGDYVYFSMPMAEICSTRINPVKIAAT